MTMERTKVSSRPTKPGSHERGTGGRVIRAIGTIGRILVVLGLILLFYTTYLLWGTSIYTKQAQGRLAQEVAAAPIVTQRTVDASGDVPPARPDQDPALGEALFTMKIPDIALDQVIVSGVGAEELKKGPGHFPESPYPGESGNVAISGHRTTYGAPFFKLDELEPGDVIDIESGPARYRYRVREKNIVSPTAVEVVRDHGVDELTLTTCHPRFSAAQRLIIHADYEGATLIDQPGPSAPPAAEPRTQPEGEETLVPASPTAVPMDVIVLGSISLAAALAAMALADRLRRYALWTAVVLGSAAGLWVGVFPQVLRLMPANY